MGVGLTTNPGRSLMVQIFRRSRQPDAETAPRARVHDSYATDGWHGRSGEEFAPFGPRKGDPRMSTPAEKPKPLLLPQYCKGCGRCIEACARHCIEMGTEIDPRTGLIPVVLHLENCSACGLCFDACPEPYGLAPEPGDTYELQDPAKLFGRKPTPAVKPVAIPDERLLLPATRPLVTKGT